MLVSGDPPTIGPDWVIVRFLNKDTAEFTDNGVLHTVAYAICALKDTQIDSDNDGTPDQTLTEGSCFGPSLRVTPKGPPAGVSSLQIFEKGADRLGLHWIQTSDTTFSRASVSQNGNVINSVDNDSDQSVVFTGLGPNAAFSLQVCVRNAEQSVDSPTCTSISASTLPRIPLAVSSVSVDESDPNPRQRTVNYTYDNEHDSAAIGLTVNIIKDDAIVKTFTEFLNGFGTKSFSHNFTGLLPFTAYEAWVIPYNQTGIGTSEGVGFTTPTEVHIAPQPLSGDSVLLRWLAPAVGGYQIQRLSGGTWQKIGDDVTVLNPSEVRVIVENMSAPQTLRVTWVLAYLHSQSDPVSPSPLSAGTPELVSVHGVAAFIPATPPRMDGHRAIPGVSARMGTRQTVTFRTTAAGNAKYILQRKTATGWLTVDSIGSLALRGANFPSGAFLALHETTSGLFTGYRVCRTHLLRIGRGTLPPQCSETSSYASEGVRRIH